MTITPDEEKGKGEAQSISDKKVSLLSLNVKDPKKLMNLARQIEVEAVV